MVLPLKTLTLIMAPFVFLVNILNKPFEGSSKKKEKLDAINDINILTRFAALNNELNSEQGQIISKSIALSKTTVKDIMIPKDKMRCLSTSMNLAEALIEAHIYHHTRFPLAENGDVDKIIGYINFKDIVSALQINPKDPSLKGIVRPILIVSTDDSLTVLLTRLTKSYQHIAIVKSKDGKTEGLVTLEDLIEFIVGDLEDEFDHLPLHLYQITESRYIAGGGVLIQNLNEKLDISIPNQSKTIADWLQEKIKDPIAVEKTYKEQNVLFTIRKIRNSKIYEVIVDKEV